MSVKSEEIIRLAENAVRAGDRALEENRTLGIQIANGEISRKLAEAISDESRRLRQGSRRLIGEMRKRLRDWARADTQRRRDAVKGAGIDIVNDSGRPATPPSQ